LENPEIEAKLQEFYDEKDLDKRIKMLHWIWWLKIENDYITNFHKELIYRDDKYVWKGIGYFRDRNAYLLKDDFDRLTTIFSFADDFWKSMVLQLMLEVNPRRAIPYLISAIETEKDDVSLGANIDWLGRYAEYIPDNLRQQVVEKIVHEAVNGIGNAREDALSTLGRLKEKAYYPILLEALKNENDDIRWWAVRGVRNTADAELIEVLPKMLNDPERDIREYVQEILDELKN
jgi:hypothetical protein